MFAKIITFVILGLLLWFIVASVITIIDNIKSRRRAAREDNENERKEKTK